MISLLQDAVKKPRLYMRRGVWVCRMHWWPTFPIGHGNTPKEAYDDWKNQV